MMPRPGARDGNRSQRTDARPRSAVETLSAPGRVGALDVACRRLEPGVELALVRGRRRVEPVALGELAVGRRIDGDRLFAEDVLARLQRVNRTLRVPVVHGRNDDRVNILPLQQPAVIGDTLHGLLNPWNEVVALPRMSLDPTRISKLTLVGCGTSYHAALVAKYWFERIARIPTEVDVASEFRYRGADMPAGGLALFISQSGETADTLAAMAFARKQGQHVLRVVNVQESSMCRQADTAILTHAGPEIGVASTKAFTTQLTVLACLVIAFAARRGKIDREEERKLCRALTEVPSRVNEVLNHDQRIAEIARTVAEARDVLYLGRGTGYPIALEGALKLKEISYIHAEGYAAGEMKHGPIALIDENMPIIVIAPSDSLFDKTASNMQEVIARGGKVIFLSDVAGIEQLGDVAAATVELPTVDPFVAPILYTIPVQLLAYHVAVLKGTDVDQPRNLAKSVTVE